MDGGSKVPELPGGEKLDTGRKTSLLGELAWQDELNDGNRVFFDLSDGMMTNYFWENMTLESDFQQSRARNYDLYKGPRVGRRCISILPSGIDVFGRGALAYEAGLGIQQAVARIQDAGLSCGLFAPVYFHQTCPKDKTPTDYATEFWNMVYLTQWPRCSGTSFRCAGHGSG